MGQKLLGVTAGSHGLGVGIEKHAVVTDGEDAGELVGHHHHRRPQTVAQLENQIIEQPGADRIEARRRLVEKITPRDPRPWLAPEPALFCIPPLICDG